MTDILMKLANEKKRLINESIARYLGHEPDTSERNQFTINHTLTVCSIYHKGKLVEEFSLDILNYNDLFEYTGEGKA